MDGFVTYVSGGLTFEYPADWRVVTGNFSPYHYYELVAALGTGDWQLNCIEQLDESGQPQGVNCSGEVLTPGPGGVEVEISSRGTPAFVIPTAPPDAVALASGLLYYVETTGSRTTWHVYVDPNTLPLDVIAQLDQANATLRRAQVQALVESIRLSR